MKIRPICKITLAFASIVLTFASISKPTAVQFSQDLNSLVHLLDSVHPKPWRHQIKQQFRDRLTKNPGLLSTYPIGPWLTISRALNGLDPKQQDSVTGVNLLKQEHTWSLLPITFGAFEEGIFVVGAEQQWNHLVGEKVNKINGVDVSSLYRKVAGYFPSHESGWVLQYLRITRLLRYLGAPCRSECSIELMKDSPGNTVKLNTSRDLIKDKSYQQDLDAVHIIRAYRNNQDKQDSLIQLGPETIYWDLSDKAVSSTLKYNETEQYIIAYLRNQLINNIILDLRDIQLTDPTLIERLWALIRKIPDESAHRVIYVMIDGSTSRLVFNLISRLNDMPEVIFVGESTGLQLSHYHDPKTVTLNRTQLTLSIATRHLNLGQDNKPFMPAHRVTWRAYDYFQGSDTVLLAILDLIEINSPD